MSLRASTPAFTQAGRHDARKPDTALFLDVEHPPADGWPASDAVTVSGFLRTSADPGGVQVRVQLNGCAPVDAVVRGNGQAGGLARLEWSADIALRAVPLGGALVTVLATTGRISAAARRRLTLQPPRRARGELELPADETVVSGEALRIAGWCLLDDSARLADIRDTSYSMLRTQLTMRSSALMLAQLAVIVGAENSARARRSSARPRRGAWHTVPVEELTDGLRPSAPAPHLADAVRRSWTPALRPPAGLGCRCRLRDGRVRGRAADERAALRAAVSHTIELPGSCRAVAALNALALGGWSNSPELQGAETWDLWSRLGAFGVPRPWSPGRWCASCSGNTPR